MSSSILYQRKFLPLFVTQFFGAFNDNVYKNTVVLLLNFGAAAKVANEAETGLLTNLAAGLLILPFFLFSPIAGQLADKYDKADLLKVVKFAEIIVMLIAALGFYFDSMPMLMFCIFLMGSQSAFLAQLNTVFYRSISRRRN